MFPKSLGFISHVHLRRLLQGLNDHLFPITFKADNSDFYRRRSQLVTGRGFLLTGETTVEVSHRHMVSHDALDAPEKVSQE